MALPPDSALPDALLEASRDLRHRVAELETLLSVIPVGIGIALDRECRRIQINPAFGCRATGNSQPE